MAVRLFVLVVALAVVGFLAVQERGARAAATVSRLALDPRGTPDADDLARAAALVRTARHVSPDTQPSVDLGVLEGRAARFPAAGRRFAAVTREEPENVRAWALLGLVAQRYDPDFAATARDRARALAPPVR